MPDKQRLARLAELHVHVLNGDETAREEIARLLVPLVQERMRRFARGADASLIEESVHDAILDYLFAPHSFDPSRSRLDTFVGLAARRNLIDGLRRLHRLAGREIVAGHPLNETLALAVPIAEPDDSCAALVAVIARSEAERAFLNARLDGERRTDVLAKLLGMADAPTSEQRRAVKRVVDRLRIRSRRLRPQLI